MARCENCSGYLVYEPEFMNSAARIRCLGCNWTLYDPRFRKEEARHFPPDSVDKRIEWQQENPGYDIYEPNSAAYQLGISKSFLKYSIRHDSSAPVIVGRGMIACNTPALQAWWDGKKHYVRDGLPTNPSTST